jgi:hypothetical protein
MSQTQCMTCLKPKAKLKCAICDGDLCKSCPQFVDEDQFSFLPEVPEFLTKGVYCTTCFDEKIAPEIETYEGIMERARHVYIFDKTQGKETRLFKRNEAPIKVEACADHNETVLRLAFLAAKAHLNAVIDMDISSKKIKDGSYTILKWYGTGIPTLVDGDYLDRKVYADDIT